jgi:hypothetical protein
VEPFLGLGAEHLDVGVTGRWLDAVTGRDGGEQLPVRVAEQPA